MRNRTLPLAAVSVLALATPIDGGVFDVDSENEFVIPVGAKLRADDVYLFAVTIEKLGGVVVSSRQRLPLLARVD